MSTQTFSLDELMTLLVAGHETTASELAWAFERLTRTPDVLERLTAEIDSRDGFPFNQLLRADVIVTAQPTQYHIDPNQQRVVGGVDDLFTNNREFARDFVAFPAHFTLRASPFDMILWDDRFHPGNPPVVTIYRRIRPTSPETAARTRDFLRGFLDSPADGRR